MHTCGAKLQGLFNLIKKKIDESLKYNWSKLNDMDVIYNQRNKQDGKKVTELWSM
jgi:hypothetical protein